jgi:hypothetical protein
MEDAIAVLRWAVPVGLLAFLCWTTANILRGLHRICEQLAERERVDDEVRLSPRRSPPSASSSPTDR